MQAVRIHTYCDLTSLCVEEVPKPIPAANEVLIRVRSAQISPSDMVNLYGYPPGIPTTALLGAKCAGEVVDAGSKARGYVGRRVAVIHKLELRGAWAQYFCVPMDWCVELNPAASWEDGTIYSNSVTAILLMDRVRKGGHRAIIQTAAASNMGRMIDRLCTKAGVVCVNVVHRPQLAEELKNAGTAIVLDSSQPTFVSDLEQLSVLHNTTFAIEAVGGDMSTQIFKSLQPGGVLCWYGIMTTPQLNGIPTRDLILHNKRVEGLMMPFCLAQAPWYEAWWVKARAMSLLGTELKAQVVARFPMEKIQEAIACYQASRSKGAVILVPNQYD